MLCVYSPDCTDFSSNGLGTISPSSALVKEKLNGEYELEIVHPLDETGKWHRLMEGYIVRAPVPSSMTPQVELANKSATSGGMVYKVTTNRDPLRLRSGTGTKYKILGKSFSDGKVSMNYKSFLGYRRGEDDMPEIVPEEAEIVQTIYRRFLEGSTVHEIAKALTAAGVPTPMKRKTWSETTVQSILTKPSIFDLRQTHLFTPRICGRG